MKPAERISQAFARVAAPLREAYEGLNDRERRLVSALGGVAVLIAIALPMYFTLDSIAAMHEENTEIKAVLRQLDQQRDVFRQRVADQEAARRRYEQKAPPLATFLETQARQQGLQLREVTDEPDQAMGAFTRRRVRGTITDASFNSFVQMLTSIENSPYPIALEKIEVDHFRQGENYTLRLGVNAYDKTERRPAAAGSEANARTENP